MLLYSHNLTRQPTLREKRRIIDEKKPKPSHHKELLKTNISNIKLVKLGAAFKERKRTKQCRTG